MRNKLLTALCVAVLMFVGGTVIAGIGQENDVEQLTWTLYGEWSAVEIDDAIEQHLGTHPEYANKERGVDYVVTVIDGGAVADSGMGVCTHQCEIMCGGAGTCRLTMDVGDGCCIVRCYGPPNGGNTCDL